MTDESLQEYASLYVLRLLEGLELAAFEAQLARDPALRKLVRDLTEASSSLAYGAPDATPSPELKARILARIDRVAPAPAPAARAEVVVLPVWIPWAAAACLAVTSAWLGQLYLTSRSEALLLRDQQTLAEFELKSAQHQLEAERLVARQELATATAGASDLDRTLRVARQQVDDANLQLASAQKLIAARDLQLALANQRLAETESRARRDADLASFKISTLASLLGNSPQALAVAVWNPARQEGVLSVDKLPALAADQDYQLWIVDPQYPNPVDAGVFTVDPATGGAHITFKGNKPIRAVAKFAVSLERKGGVPKAEGPMVLISP
jgi:anti-sigma-K factor RskA